MDAGVSSSRRRDSATAKSPQAPSPPMDPADERVERGADQDTRLWRLLVGLLRVWQTILQWLYYGLLRAWAPVRLGPLTQLQRERRALEAGAVPQTHAQLENSLSQATSYAEWARLALALDNMEGAEAWKQEPRSPLYSASLLAERLAALRAARRTNDPAQVATTLRSGLLRNLGGMGNPELFSRCRLGSKRLIADYVGEVVRQLEFIEAAAPCEQFPLLRKFEFFHQTRQAFGRTALLLSGGGGLGMYHFGVIKALHEEGLLPKVISGASVGALIGSLVCCTPDHEIGRIFEPGAIRLDAFERKQQAGAPAGSATARRLRRLLQKGVLMDVRTLEATVRENVGDVTFLEAFERTGRSLHVSVNSPNEPPRLLNFLTAPNVLVWSAATASCALAGLYEPVELLAKCPLTGAIQPYHPSKLVWTDGSVQTDLPMLRLAELMNVNHFLVSQVNPHVLPFLDPDHADSMSRLNRRQARGHQWDRDGAPSDTRRRRRNRQRASRCWTGGWAYQATVGVLGGVVRAAKYLVTSELRHRVNQLCGLGLLPSALSPLSALLNQPYTGHVTIVPRIGWRDYTHLLSNPTEERRQECIRVGELATWPRIAFIKAHCAIEQALDVCVERCRQKIKLAGGVAGAAAVADPRPDLDMFPRIPSYGEFEAFID